MTQTMAASVLFLIVTLVFGLVDAKSDPVVKISDGVLRGSWTESTKGRTYASFEGIPYARPPVGVHKFREPRPLKPWTGVRNATEHLHDCLQYDPFFQIVQGEEDCLYLNVYTPKPDAKDLPVIVFIHGGSFMYGAGAVYNPTHVMDRDLVLVTINYRLGPIGFISTGDSVAPGNVGLKDQVFALKWVQKNIKKFGGDPAEVTLMGVSSGAASVHYHFLSSLSKGTFSKGIAFSGSAFAPWAHSIKPVEKTKALATILDCPTSSSKKMMDCLKGLPGDDIFEAATKMYDWKVQMFTPFVPSVEPEVKGAFLTKSPLEATEVGDMFEGPLLVSVTSEEGLYPAALFQRYPEMLTELADRWEELASDIFQYNDSLPIDRRASVAAEIKERYFKNKPIGQNTFDKLVQAIGDRIFVADSGRLAQVHARSGQNVYLARYSFRGEKSFSNVLTWSTDDYGTAHADDILHIFKLPFLWSAEPDDVRMTRALINMIYSFAINGVPQLSRSAPDWSPLTPGSADLKYMEISSAKSFEMKSSTDFGQRAFWDSLGFVEDNSLNEDG